MQYEFNQPLFDNFQKDLSFALNPFRTSLFDYDITVFSS